MKKEIFIRASYHRMKKKYGADTLILFHVGKSYEAYYNDAGTISNAIGIPLFDITVERIPTVRVPEDKLEVYRNRLLNAEYAVCISDVRGVSGRHIIAHDE